MSDAIGLEPVYLSLGSNLGDRRANLAAALDRLACSGIDVLRTSSLYETEPQDVVDQPWFLNQVAECQMRFTPQDLLLRIHDIEYSAGRVRKNAQPRGPRVIDIDILLFGSAVINASELQIPHPRMLERRFVLVPLLELCPQLTDPRTGVPLQQALESLAGQQVRKISPR